MKVELIQEEEDEKDINYPCLMGYKSDGCLEPFIVLFIEESKGIVIGDSQDFKNGEYYEDWRMSCFMPYNGKVVLEND